MTEFSPNFDKSIKLILELEGGYVNDPKDPGGETKYGISKRAFPNLDIKNLTVDQAKQIYFDKYWKHASCEKLPFNLALINFDTAVNMGIKTANKTLQLSINSQFNKENHIIVDGIIGPKTLKVLGKCNSNIVFADYMRHRTNKYFSLANKNKKLTKFLKGWINRVLKVNKYVLQNS